MNVAELPDTRSDPPPLEAATGVARVEDEIIVKERKRLDADNANTAIGIVAGAIGATLLTGGLFPVVGAVIGGASFRVFSKAWHQRK